MDTATKSTTSTAIDQAPASASMPSPTFANLNHSLAPAPPPKTFNITPNTQYRNYGTTPLTWFQDTHFIYDMSTPGTSGFKPLTAWLTNLMPIQRTALNRLDLRINAHYLQKKTNILGRSAYKSFLSSQPNFLRLFQSEPDFLMPERRLRIMNADIRPRGAPEPVVGFEEIQDDLATAIMSARWAGWGRLPDWRPDKGAMAGARKWLKDFWGDYFGPWIKEDKEAEREKLEKRSRLK